jgi:hypothetical protein
MAFQFQCPRGDLLEGDESQAGQESQCPVCGMLFVVPQPIQAPAPIGQPEPSPLPHFAFDTGEAAPANRPTEPELLHIPCPNGHELETPVEMLDQEVLCPQCNIQFRLRRKDSVEYKRKKELQEKIRLEKAGNLWLNVAIAAVVIVVIGLLALLIISHLNQPR